MVGQPLRGGLATYRVGLAVSLPVCHNTQALEVKSGGVAGFTEKNFLKWAADFSMEQRVAGSMEEELWR